MRFWLRMPKLSYPVCWLLWEPPTSKPRIRTPDVWPSTAQTSVADGTSCSSSTPKSFTSAVVRMSTTGASPVTVTVSATVATSSAASIRITRLPSTITPSRTRVPNPASSNVRSYDPRPRARKR